MANAKKVILWIAGGCGVVMLLAGATCVGVYYWGKSKVNEVKAEMAKDPGGKFLSDAISQGAAKGAKTGEGGFVGALQGMAGAGIAMGVSAISLQVIPSLPAAEQAAAKEVFKAFNEKAGSMGQAQFDAVNAMMDRYNQVVEPEQKAKSAALEKVADPAEKLRLTQDMLKVNPEAARRFVKDLKDLTDSMK